MKRYLFAIITTASILLTILIISKKETVNIIYLGEVESIKFSIKTEWPFTSGNYSTLFAQLEVGDYGLFKLDITQEGKSFFHVEKYISQSERFNYKELYNLIQVSTILKKDISAPGFYNISGSFSGKLKKPLKLYLMFNSSRI